MALGLVKLALFWFFFCVFPIHRLLLKLYQFNQDELTVPFIQVATSLINCLKSFRGREVHFPD